MFQLLRSILLTSILALSLNSHAVTKEVENDVKNTVDSKKHSNYQEIIDKYKAYLATVNPKVQKEIQAYRVENAKLQQQKRELYKKLSNDAQEFLKATQELRRQLPIQQRRNFNQEVSNLQPQQVNN